MASPYQGTPITRSASQKAPPPNMMPSLASPLPWAPPLTLSAPPHLITCSTS